MRENVSYQEVTCDICGEKGRFDSSVVPSKWHVIDVGHGKIDVCDSCYRYICEVIQRLPLLKAKKLDKDSFRSNVEYLEGMIAYEQACEHRLARSGFSDAEQMDIQTVILDKAEEDFRAGVEDLYKE